MTKISVVIPTYKPGDYLIDCLKSLEKQTIDKRLFEVIIVLNGPKEPFFDKISDLMLNIEFCSKLYYSEIIGVSNARNLALDNIKSNFIVFVDDDDVVSTGYLEGLFSLAENGSIVISNSKIFKDDINYTSRDYTGLAFDSCKNRKRISVLRGRHFFSTCWGKLIPISVIGKTRFENKLKNAEDSVFMVEISRNISDVIIASDDVIYYIRVRYDSASRRRRPFVEILKSKYYEFKKYLSFYLRFPPMYNLIFVSIMIVAGLKSFIEDIYKSIRYCTEVH